MKNLLATILLLIAVPAFANNLTIRFVEEEVLADNNHIASIPVKIFSKNTEVHTGSIELLTGKLPPSIKSTVPLDKIILAPNVSTYIPIWLQLPGTGYYKVTLCVRGEPISQGRNTVSVRSCDVVMVKAF